MKNWLCSILFKNGFIKVIIHANDISSVTIISRILFFFLLLCCKVHFRAFIWMWEEVLFRLEDRKKKITPVWFLLFLNKIHKSLNKAYLVSVNLLTEKSKERHKIEFNCLKAWTTKKYLNTIKETVLLTILMKWFVVLIL